MKVYKIISRTASVCPVCLKKIDAKIVSDGKASYMKKSCPEHGKFKTLVWKGSIPMENWVRKKERAYIKNPTAMVDRGCPLDCGLCSEHRQHTCTALIEVTQNCNLHCSYCFADSFAHKANDPSLEQIKFMYESVKKSSGTCNIQLSGGEPTVREDLPSIIKMGKEMGFNFIQVNTNGIRISENEGYVKELKDAGLSSIFLQFDGTMDSIYKKLRGRELLETKLMAIENCRKHGIGVVLVPTLVPGINLDNIGEILELALESSEVVRGVHFQPVSYFGRIPSAPKDRDRVTLPEVMDEIVSQTRGKIKLGSLKPPGCENALCSFHGSYICLDDKNLMSITNNSSCSCSDENERDKAIVKGKGITEGSSCGPGCSCNSEKAETGAVKAKAYVSRNWSGRKAGNSGDEANTESNSDWDEILRKIKSNSFSISGMAFQDAWNVDIERVRDCCIHVVNNDGKLIPFCLYNMTDTEGRYLYRK